MRGFTATFNSMGIIQHSNQGIIYIPGIYIIYTYDYIYVYVSYKLSSITFFAIKATCPKNQKKQPLIQRQDTERKHGLRWCACPEAAVFSTKRSLMEWKAAQVLMFHYGQTTVCKII